MEYFSDRLIQAIKAKGNPCIVGLDPRLEKMPTFITSQQYRMSHVEAIRFVIANYHEIILDIISPLIPAVKPQIAFYEQYGIPGLLAFVDTIKMAKERDLIVIADVKRNDISSTATAYANAFLGTTNIFDDKLPIFDVDCITVSPFLGRDSIEPFVKVCQEYGKGVFVLVKTSNPSSGDFQDKILKDSQEPLYSTVARAVNDLAKSIIGESGYSSVGAVVGATYPEEAVQLRKLMPQSIFLVPGYGTQGGTARDVLPCFNKDKLGAIVNSSRGITYAHKDNNISKEEFIDLVYQKITTMVDDFQVTSVK